MEENKKAIEENKKAAEENKNKSQERPSKKAFHNPYLLFLILILLVKSFEAQVSSKNTAKGVH
ncbi:MAG: hypothetical protein DIU66_003445 [Bacillota bacterium]